MTRNTRVVVAGGGTDGRHLPRGRTGFTVTAQVPSLSDPRCHDADLVVLDLDFDRNAVDLVALATATALPPVLVTGTSLLRSDIWMARRCGARGYVAPTGRTLPALRALRDGEEHWPTGLGAAPAWLAEPDPLIRFGVFTRMREHARYARLLHDNVLQTLEGLALLPSTDAAVRGLLAGEAARLRAFIAGPPGTTNPGLAGALSALADEHRARGLQISLSTVGVDDLAPAAVSAVADAVAEALRNVVKHAATDRATVVVRRRGGTVVVRVADSGSGFDPVARPAGFGLAESIGGRLSAVGGRVSVTAAPGRGTVLELTVPVRRQHVIR